MAGIPKLVGDDLVEAVRLRDSGWSFARIGKHFGCAEASASNAVIAVLCVREGHRPASRGPDGRLLPAEIDRLRYMLRKGMKGVDIQLHMAVSASCVAEQRRRYNAELKANGKRLLPPPGNGEAYSGARVPKEKRAEVERLLLTGMGGPKISDATGVSKTHVQRIRGKLIKRLKRKGEALPGCDAAGRRVRVFGSAREIPQSAKEKLRSLILARMPVRRAAKLCGIGSCSAYRLRDQWAAELAADGKELPRPKLPGRVKPHVSRMLASEGIPSDRIYRLRKLAQVHGDDEALRMIRAEIAAARARPLTFEEQLERVSKGAGLVSTFKPQRTSPEHTLGGVATGQLEAA